MAVIPIGDESLYNLKIKGPKFIFDKGNYIDGLNAVQGLPKPDIKHIYISWFNPDSIETDLWSNQTEIIKQTAISALRSGECFIWIMPQIKTDLIICEPRRRIDDLIEKMTRFHSRIEEILNCEDERARITIVGNLRQSKYKNLNRQYLSTVGSEKRTWRIEREIINQINHDAKAEMENAICNEEIRKISKNIFRIHTDSYMTNNMIKSFTPLQVDLLQKLMGKPSFNLTSCPIYGIITNQQNQRTPSVSGTKEFNNNPMTTNRKRTRHRMNNSKPNSSTSFHNNTLQRTIFNEMVKPIMWTQKSCHRQCLIPNRTRPILRNRSDTFQITSEYHSEDDNHSENNKNTPLTKIYQSDEKNDDITLISSDYEDLSLDSLILKEDELLESN